MTGGVDALTMHKLLLEMYPGMLVNMVALADLHVGHCQSALSESYSTKIA